MSALPPKADIGTQSWNVRFVPKADSCAAANHLIVGASGIKYLFALDLNGNAVVIVAAGNDR